MHNQRADRQRRYIPALVHGECPQQDAPRDTPVGTAAETSTDPRISRLVAWIPADPAAVLRTRHRLHRLLCDAELSSVAFDVELAAQELMANAVAHGCRGHAAEGFTLKATCQRGRVRVEVRDLSPELPRLRVAAEECEGGRGLLLVASLATRWGVQEHTGLTPGKTVWMELDVAAADES